MSLSLRATLYLIVLSLALGGSVGLYAQAPKIKTKSVTKASKADKKLALALIEALGKPDGYEAISTDVYRSEGEIPSNLKVLKAASNYATRISAYFEVYRLVKSGDYITKNTLDNFRKEEHILPTSYPLKKDFDGYIAVHKYRESSSLTGKGSFERCTVFLLDKDLSKVLSVENWADFAYGYILGALDTLPELFKQEQSIVQAITSLPERQVPLSPKELPTTPPSFPGGEAGIAKYLSDNMRDLKQNITVRLQVPCTVDADGSICNIQLLGRVRYHAFYLEAFRLLLSMPKWEPGKLNDKAVSTEILIPISL